MIRRVWAILLTLTAGLAHGADEPPLGWADSPSQDAGIVAIDTRAPRPFGQVVGDRLVLTYRVTVAPGTTLQRASLPLRRRIDDWLERQEVEVATRRTDKGQQYEITLTYQTFDTPLGVTTKTVPGFEVRFTRPEQPAVTARMPAWSFAQSPLLSENVADEGDNIVSMQPDIEPFSARDGGHGALLAFSVLPLAGGLGWLLWLYQPWRPRHARHFAEALAAVRAQRRTSAPDALAAAFRHVHRGFDHTAGQAVFAADVDAFCRRFPRFAACRDDIDAFFADSRRLFFDQQMPDRDDPWADLEALAVALRDAERDTRT
ncbi:hypothetical protein RM531_14790 [Salinisphaera sp. P385]|uniref:MxaA protein n=1 Tax=Spectribacter acetivorans TaxID=3075603 RepID=A0ABU3BD64_9GAMM|nr:hypothetical protein [Salinisphaera sp. P385]MDT0619742.1 hypothetical protein [Salinisphaera sp. P385]